ncbi:hypothetical protein B0H19DRAFT_1077976 [Mycena capillaripes]|nr:hypothetical protein B0H19DRAFT_1077976 [Mycena capillaripes]
MGSKARISSEDLGSDRYHCLVANAELDAKIIFLSLESRRIFQRDMRSGGNILLGSDVFCVAKKTQDLGHKYQALRYLGDNFLAQKDEETALSVFQVVLDGSTEMDVHRRRADCMSRMGDIHLRRGELDRAKQLWETARPLFVRSSCAKDATLIGSKLAQLARNKIETSVRSLDDDISAKDSDISSKLSR